jgi:hypothetical protein
MTLPSRVFNDKGKKRCYIGMVSMLDAETGEAID